MKVTVNLNKEQLEMLDQIVDYYKRNRPDKISTRDTVLAACMMKVWHDWDDKKKALRKEV